MKKSNLRRFGVESTTVPDNDVQRKPKGKEVNAPSYVTTVPRPLSPSVIAMLYASHTEGELKCLTTGAPKWCSWLSD